MEHLCSALRDCSLSQYITLRFPPFYAYTYKPAFSPLLSKAWLNVTPQAMSDNETDFENEMQEETKLISFHFGLMGHISRPLKDSQDEQCQKVNAVIQDSIAAWQEVDYCSKKSNLLIGHKEAWLTELAPFHVGICQSKDCPVREGTSNGDEWSEKVQNPIHHLTWAVKACVSDRNIYHRLTQADIGRAKILLTRLQRYIRDVFHPLDVDKEYDHDADSMTELDDGTITFFNSKRSTSNLLSTSASIPDTAG